jgi:hypothetical protein
MKHFLITYRFSDGSQDDWHDEVRQFIAAIENDPALRGRIAYRVHKAPDGRYFHVAATADDSAGPELNQREWFTRYTDATARVGGGHVEVIPLEIVGETAFRA